MDRSPPQFDAIVVGSGISGGWAAKELTEKGLKVLMLERGRMVEHGKDYKGEHTPPWKIPYAGKPLRELYEKDYPIQQNSYAFDETTRHFWNNDRENPYVYNGQFNWMRANVVGGRSLLWGRQVYRWSDLDFEANKRDGHGIDWPIRYKDIAPWYSYVEKFIGVSGQVEGLPQLPDGEFLPPMEMNVVEKEIKSRIEKQYADRKLTIGRTAILTKPLPGRASCHYCGPCQRGCSAGAYFSTQSSTLPAAEKTDNLTLLPDSVVEKIEYDPRTKRARGVRVVNAQTGERSFFSSRIVFLCASTVGSTQILLNSRSDQHQTGLGNQSGSLGRYLMDHPLGSGAFGIMPGFDDKYIYGVRPNGIYLPRFRNVDSSEKLDFLRGYGFQGGATRLGWSSMHSMVPGFGKDFKHGLRKPGPWVFYMGAFGECLPYKENRMELVENKKDRFGIPQVRFHFKFRENEEKMASDIVSQSKAMLEKAGLVNVTTFSKTSTGGDGIHEMGTARMGRDPSTSVLNEWNQVHSVPNVFVTDGSCMTSSSCVNPSITYMALTARAADYAVKQLRANQI